MRVRRLVMSLLALGALRAPALDAQTVRGRVLDDVREHPVPLVLVTLLLDGGPGVDSARTDSLGAFTLEAPLAGQYRLRARRVGFEHTTTDPIALARGQTLELDFLLALSAVALDSVRVAPDSSLHERVMQAQTRSAHAVGGRVVTRAQIEKHLQRVSTTAALLERLRIPGLSMRRGPSAETCLTLRRQSGCMTVYVDDQRTVDINVVPPAMIEQIIVLRASQAGGLFGDGAGLLLVYTRPHDRANRRLPGTPPDSM